MTDNENRRHQMFVRVRNFGAARSEDFNPTSLGTQLFTTLSAVVTELDAHAASQASGRGAARQGTSTRAQTREALREDMEAISRTAKAMAHEVPGIGDKFRMPRAENDQLLLQSARAFGNDGAQFATQFVGHEMPADFLTALNARITALEASMGEQSSGRGSHVAAGAAIDTAINNGVLTVRRLDAIVRNKYANSPATLAEWTSASHTERAPKRKSDSPSTPPPPAGSPAPSA